MGDNGGTDLEWECCKRHGHKPHNTTEPCSALRSRLRLQSSHVSSCSEFSLENSEFSLENEVFKPFFCGQTVGKYVTFVAAVAVAGRISLRPLPCCII